jgi:hypothetical protein
MSAVQIPQGTSRTVMLKLFTSGTTTAATGKTVAVTLSKNGGAFGNPNAGATSATEVSSGWYKVTVDATDTGTLGDLVVRGTAAGCDDSERLFAVVNANTGGLGALPNAAANANGGLPVLSSSGTTLAYTVSTLTTYAGNTPQTGDVYARIGAAGAGLTALGDGRLAHLDADVSSRLASASYTAPDNTTLAHVATALELSAGNYRFTVAALANAPSGGAGGDPWATAQPGAYAVTTFGGLVAAKLGLLTSGVGRAVGPVSPATGEIALVRGDDYLATDGRELSWAAPASGWPGLAGASVTLSLGPLPPVPALAVGPPVTFELTRAQTTALPPGPAAYAVRAALADGSAVTLALGHCRVVA